MPWGNARYRAGLFLGTREPADCLPHAIYGMETSCVKRIYATFGKLLKAATFLLGVPVAALLAYDVVAVRPRLSRIEAILAAANPNDAAPPVLVRRLIDANAGSPTAHAT